MSAVRVVWVLYMDVKHATATSCRGATSSGDRCVLRSGCVGWACLYAALRVGWSGDAHSGGLLSHSLYLQPIVNNLLISGRQLFPYPSRMY